VGVSRKFGMCRSGVVRERCCKRDATPSARRVRARQPRLRCYTAFRCDSLYTRFFCIRHLLGRGGHHRAEAIVVPF
jgi:hypothetical protein